MTEDSLIIRPISGEDSFEELTSLLHRAYKRLADMGQQFVATSQSVEVTRSRVEKSECYVAILDDKIVGTIAFRAPHQTSGCDWYDRPDIASFGQFAVDPEKQGHGIGRALLERCEGRARESGASELALDTSENAQHLIELYERWGFRRVGHANWGVTNYRSVIMSKKV